MLRILLQLAQGVDPETGEIYGEESPYQRPVAVRALFLALRELEHGETSQQAPKKPESFKAPPLDEAGALILGHLRKWRTEKAKALLLPPYIIFSDKTLAHIAFLRPTTPEQLLQAHGVGPAKVGQFGEEILALVRGLLPAAS